MTCSGLLLIVFPLIAFAALPPLPELSKLEKSGILVKDMTKAVKDDAPACQVTADLVLNTLQGRTEAKKEFDLGAHMASNPTQLIWNPTSLTNEKTQFSGTKSFFWYLGYGTRGDDDKVITKHWFLVARYDAPEGKECSSVGGCCQILESFSGQRAGESNLWSGRYSISDTARAMGWMKAWDELEVAMLPTSDGAYLQGRAENVPSVFKTGGGVIGCNVMRDDFITLAATAATADARATRDELGRKYFFGQGTMTQWLYPKDTNNPNRDFRGGFESIGPPPAPTLLDLADEELPKNKIHATKLRRHRTIGTLRSKSRR